jgi:hypothetical protein
MKLSQRVLQWQRRVNGKTCGECFLLVLHVRVGAVGWSVFEHAVASPTPPGDGTRSLIHRSGPFSPDSNATIPVTLAVSRQVGWVAKNWKWWRNCGILWVKRTMGSRGQGD